MKKVLWENENLTLNSNEYQSVSLTNKSLIVDNGKNKLFYKLVQVNHLVEKHKNDGLLFQLLYQLRGYEPYKITKRDE